MNAIPVPEAAAVALSQSLSEATESIARSVLSLSGRRWPASAVAYSEDLVLTAAHAIHRLDRVTLSASGEQFSAEVLGRDAALDLALLRVPGAHFLPAPWRPSAGVRAGALVLAVSRPHDSVRVRLGLLGGVGPAFQTPLGAHVDTALLLEVSPRPGLAGAVLADVSGQGLGLLVSGLGASRRMVVPMETLSRTVDELRTHGRVRRGYLGVGTQAIQLPSGLAGAEGRGRGLLVVAVEPGSPAESAGLLFGDVLLRVGGTPTEDVQDLLGTLAVAPLGEALTVQLHRGGQLTERSVTVGARR